MIPSLLGIVRRLRHNLPRDWDVRIDKKHVHSSPIDPEPEGLLQAACTTAIFSTEKRTIPDQENLTLESTNHIARPSCNSACL
jgi:hypothetical protein